MRKILLQFYNEVRSKWRLIAVLDVFLTIISFELHIFLFSLKEREVLGENLSYI